MNNYLSMEIKEVGESGSFKGIASMYGATDLDRDVIEKGAFSRTLAEKSQVPLLWQHDSRSVIGIATLKEWGDRVMLDGRLDLADPMGAHAHRKMRGDSGAGLPPMVKGLSIGFSIPNGKSSWNEEKGIRHIHELDLWEVSVVTFPALPQAQITSVKSHEDLVQQIELLKNEIKALQQQIASAGKPSEPESDSRAISLITELRQRMSA